MNAASTHNRERRYTAYSVGGSVAIHVVLLCVWGLLWEDNAMSSDTDSASYINFPGSLVDLITAADADQKAEERRRELNRKPYVRTSANQLSPTAPLEPMFISDRNTLAESVSEPDLAAADPIPNIPDGADLPGNQLYDREFQDGRFETESATPSGRTSPAPSAPAPSSTMPPPNSPPEADSLSSEPRPPGFPERLPDDPEAIPDLPAFNPEARLGETPPPPAPVSEEAEPSTTAADLPPDLIPPQEDPFAQTRPQIEAPPSSVPLKRRETDTYRPETRRSLSRGSAPRGDDDSFAAENSPMGRYLKIIDDRIGREWHRNMRKKPDLLRTGMLRIRFRVNDAGQPQQLDVLKNGTNAIVEDLTLQAILDAEIPPMPRSIRELTDQNGLEIVKTFYIY